MGASRFWLWKCRFLGSCSLCDPPFTRCSHGLNSWSGVVIKGGVIYFILGLAVLWSNIMKRLNLGAMT